MSKKNENIIIADADKLIDASEKSNNVFEKIFEKIEKILNETITTDKNKEQNNDLKTNVV